MIFLKGVIIVPTLETKRLQLIPFTLDLKKAAMNDRVRLVEMLGVHVPEHWPEPDLAEALPVFVEKMEKAPSEPVWDWIAIHRLDQGVIGGIGFMEGPNKDGVVEVGYDIVPEYRKQGYATEMARSLIAWAFQETGINVVTASCLDDNIGSIKVLENVGMRRLELDGNMLKWEIRKENWATARVAPTFSPMELHEM
jgi:[ribosomal protein S5]-alanine N-acetyltransferase